MYDVSKLTKVGQLKEVLEKVKDTRDAIPANVSQLANDAGYLTEHQDISGKADKGTSLAAYGITDGVTKDEMNARMSSVYKPGGSVAFADLPAADEAHLGMVYNITNAFTTTAAFVEGAGKKHPEGTNVVIVAGGNEGEFKYDVLAGFVDLSDYVTDDMVATDEEFSEMMKEVFGEEE